MVVFQEIDGLKKFIVKLNTEYKKIVSNCMNQIFFCDLEPLPMLPSAKALEQICDHKFSDPSKFFGGHISVLHFITHFKQISAHRPTK